MTWEPVLAFTTDSPDFVHGFEAGTVWQALKDFTPEATTDFIVHWANAEILLRIAEHYGRPLEVKPTDDVWGLAVFGPVEQ